MQSGCFVRQGTKVGSTEECGQILSNPRRVKQDATNTFPKQSWLPVDPKRTQHSPVGLKAQSISPVNSASLSPARHGRLTRVYLELFPHKDL